jgi:hypothetical protein
MLGWLQVAGGAAFDGTTLLLTSVGPCRAQGIVLQALGLKLGHQIAAE